jgi:hypothetical protein
VLWKTEQRLVNIEQIIDAIRRNRIRITDHADEEAQTDRLAFDEYSSVFFRAKSLKIIQRIGRIPVA